MNNNNSNNENEQRNIQSQPLSKKEIEKKQNHEASQDVAHTVGKGAATYFGGALGNKLYDVASKTKLGQGIEKGVGKVLESSPVAKPAMNALHKSGATKIANTAIDAFGGKKTTLNNGMSNINKGLKSTNKSLGISPQNNMTISNRGNRIVNTSGIQNEEPDFENMTEEEIENYEKQKELEEIQQKKEQKEKRDAKVKSVVKFLMKNPQIALFIGIAIFILIILIILIYMIAADMDLVGNRGVSYETADSVSGYCDQIILIKEHDDYTGDPVASIDDVNLEETFRLGNKDVKRWKYQTINLEDYVKGVLQAETSIIHDQKTYEVASIVARTYAVEITSRQCYTWDNTNKRVQYRNPQNYTSSNIDSDIAAAVSATNGLIAYDKDKIIDMSQNNYYDYFCYNKITNSKEEDKSYFEMVQENEEERLLISVDWTKDNNNVADGDAKKWGYSGKYNGGIYTNDCQEDGLSLYGAKYLLNKKQDAYTTIRILMYYYTYDLELKRIENFGIGGGCYWWPVENGGGNITSKFGPRSLEGKTSIHSGLDIAVSLYTPIIASNSGQVVEVYTSCPKTTAQDDCGGGWGNHVRIKHADGNYTNYAHLSDVLVNVGQNVNQGEVIGKSGNSGHSRGAHLHFEVWTGDKTNSRVDPLNFISQGNPKPSCGFGTGSGGIVNTGDNVKSICLTLKNLGYSDNSIAAVLTNMYHENTSFNPTTRNEISCLGIAQWCYDTKKTGNGYQVFPGTGRLGNLESLANYDTFEVQLNFMVNELITGSRGNIHQTMLNGGNIAELTEVYCNKFETPGKSECAKRRNNTEIQTKYLNFSQNGCN